MTTDTDVAAIFDLAADAMTTADADPTTENTDNTDNTENTPESPDLYPNVLRTYTASEVGEGNPPNTLTVAEFAAELTVRNVLAGAGATGVVKDANIYTGIKAKRHTLPVVLVFPDGADQKDQKAAKVYLPVKEATDVYDERPERGSGNAAASKRSQDELLEDAAKKYLALEAIRVRLVRTQGQFDKTAKQMDKYHGWLGQFFLGTEVQEVTDEDGTKRLETQDEANKRALTTAITERAEKIEEEEAAKSDAEKSDIPDNDNA